MQPRWGLRPRPRPPRHPGNDYDCGGGGGGCQLGDIPPDAPPYTPAPPYACGDVGAIMVKDGEVGPAPPYTGDNVGENPMPPPIAGAGE